MGLTTDRNSPCLSETDTNTGQQKCYLILSEEERAKGFVRPVRTSYKHIGVAPRYPLRDLTAEEQARYASEGYAKFEAYPESHSPVTGRFWTEAQLHSGCGCVTTMAQGLAETYARQPNFYGATWCCQCMRHIPVGEFVWEGTQERLGS